MVGGVLYSAGGYFLPFVVLGTILFTVANLTLFILPKHEEPLNNDKKYSVWDVLRIPGVAICTLAIVATSASIGFISATLEPHMRSFLLSPIALGAIFCINGAVYAGTAPIFGCLIDNYCNPKFVTIVGSILIIISFLLIGPAAFIPWDT